MDTTVVASLLTWVEGHDALAPLPVGLEDFPVDDRDAVMLSLLSGDPVVKRYKSGGYIAAQQFQLILRTHLTDTAARLDAMRRMSDVASSIEDSGTWPVAPDSYDYHMLTVRTAPVPVAVDDSGARDYQLTMELAYRQRG